MSDNGTDRSSSPTPHLALADGESVADLATLVARARHLEHEGAIRLQSVGEVLAAWVCVLPGRGLTRNGLTLGLRTMALAEPLELDVTVPLGAMTDRFARRAGTGDATTAIPVPPGEVAPPWAGISPPRGGWEPVGRIGAEVLRAWADAGIGEVARGAPEGSGAAAVADLRARVWGREIVEGVPSSLAFAAHVLGFLPAEGEGTVHRSGPWTRLALSAGQVLVR